MLGNQRFKQKTKQEKKKYKLFFNQQQKLNKEKKIGENQTRKGNQKKNKQAKDKQKK